MKHLFLKFGEKELKDNQADIRNAVLKVVKMVEISRKALERKSKEKSMKEKSTDFVTPTKASGEAQEEEISLLPFLEIRWAAKTLSNVAFRVLTRNNHLFKGRDTGEEEQGGQRKERLNAQLDEEVAKEIHLDKYDSKRMAEEESFNRNNKRKEKAQVQFEAQFYTEED
ncbi:hypothetical protein Tco_0085644 [Tanacetum coccineum]